MKKAFRIVSLISILGIFFWKNPIVVANDITNDVVEEGIYELYTYVNDTKVIEVIGSSKIDGANVEIYERGNQDNQKFQLKVNKDGTYTFFAIHSNKNKVLDVSMADGNVSQYELHGGDNQKWYIKQTSDGYCNIISKANEKYLDVEKAQGKDCQNIQVYEGHGGSSQKFKLVKVQNTKGSKTIEDGIYHIKSQVADNRFLEIPNSQTKEGTNIQTGKENNLANQKFEIIYNNDGTYSITVLHSGKLLEVQNGSGKNETPVVQYTKKEENSQKWVMIKNNNNTYSLIAACNGLALDVKSANTNVGATLQTYYFHGQKSQQFTFELCKPEIGSKTVENGTYRVLSTINNKKVWEMAYSSRENGANVLMWENTKSLQQKFDIEYVGEGYYKIKSKISNKVLTVESENPQIGSTITQQEDNNLDTQKWILKKYAPSVYGILSKCRNLYITIPNANISNGQNMQLGRQTDLASQQFILVNETPKEKISNKIGNGVYQIITKGNKVVEVAGSSYKNATNMSIWNNLYGQNQKYQITCIGNTGYYKIIAIHSGKSLDVEGGNANLGANIIQYDDTQTNNQQWLLKDCGDGYYNIISKDNGLYLDVTSGQISTPGAKMELWYENEADNQKFQLRPICIVDNNTYEIETRLDSNKVVNIQGNSKQDGANVLLWEAENVDHARFCFEALSTDTYKIIAKSSNKALTVDTRTNDVYQASYTGANNQQWQITPAGEGYYHLICKANGLALDVYAASAQNNQSIQVYNPHHGAGQKFKFVTGFRKFYQEGTYGRTGLAIAGDGRGSNLKYYKYGKGSKVLFTNFSIHGFEDSYHHDGAELTYIAEEFKKYLDNHIEETIVNNWTIYIFPCLNPDGQNHGYTNNGPGRNTLFSAAPGNKGIDMNRNWSVGYKRETSNRNYNGTAPFQAYESQSLREFMLNHQGTTKNFTIDTHGWLNETIGDNGLGAYYRNQFGLPTHISSYGSGYLVNWARTLKNARSVLVELPQVSNHSQTVSRNYAQKFINATMQMLREN